MGDLPFEKIARTVLVRQEGLKTSEKFGCDPFARSMEETLQYGIVNIDKPSGPTSHQVSAFVQKILGIKKSGHSGTLDPKVTGCLPIALGRGTRVVQGLLTAGKEYVCVMHLHDTVAEEKIKDVMLKQFVGKIRQLPPVKSAVKRQYRNRKIYYIDILDIQGQEVLFYVGCQAGTYIRKLCLHPETELLLPTGHLDVKAFTQNPSEIYTMDDKKTRTGLPSETQKFSFQGPLYKITMSSGISFMVTPEHKMLISTPQGYVMKQAQAMTTSDYIVKSLDYVIPNKKYIISDLLDDSYLVEQQEIKEKVKKIFIKKYGSIRAMNRALGFDRKAFLKNSSSAITLDHIKKSGLYADIKNTLHTFKSTKGTLFTCASLSKDLCYILGLIASDGNNSLEKGTTRRTRILFHNKELALIKKFESAYKKLFPQVNYSINKLSSGLFQFDSSNSFLATIAGNLGVKSPQKEFDLEPLLYLEKKLLASFLKGYFDGDGTAYYKKRGTHTYSKIDYFTVSETNAKRLHQMLLKLNISSTIFQKKNLFVVSISTIAAKKRFISLVGSNHPLKQERFSLILTQREEELDDMSYVGFHFKELFRQQKTKLHKLGGNLSRILASDTPLTRKMYTKARTLAALPRLDDFQIEKIKSIKKVEYSGFVYDMTVPNTHNFLIETGFVSSNCHDIGEALGVGAHMAELRRTKAGPFNEGTALCTLQDLTDAFHYYKQDGDDTRLRDVVKPIEVAVDHLPKVWIADTAVDAIAHGATLKAPGIVKVESEIQVGEPVAILTLKDELVAVGESLMISKDMQTIERGVAVKSSQVFMQTGVYPKVDKV